jgi:hypothetical protein
VASVRIAESGASAMAVTAVTNSISATPAIDVFCRLVLRPGCPGS